MGRVKTFSSLTARIFKRVSQYILFVSNKKNTHTEKKAKETKANRTTKEEKKAKETKANRTTKETKEKKEK